MEAETPGSARFIEVWIYAPHDLLCVVKMALRFIAEAHYEAHR